MNELCDFYEFLEWKALEPQIEHAADIMKENNITEEELYNEVDPVSAMLGAGLYGAGKWAWNKWKQRQAQQAAMENPEIQQIKQMIANLAKRRGDTKPEALRMIMKGLNQLQTKDKKPGSLSPEEIISRARGERGQQSRIPVAQFVDPEEEDTYRLQGEDLPKALPTQGQKGDIYQVAPPEKVQRQPMKTYGKEFGRGKGSKYYKTGRTPTGRSV